ncbi:MAG: ABC transporter permease [Ginsengibacter sp.]
MIKNYFKTAIRNFTKNKLTTTINVFGLAIGISAALVIFLVIQYDYSFDKFEPGRDRIYRVVSEGANWKNPGVPAPLHIALAQNVSGVEAVVPMFGISDGETKVTIPQGNQETPTSFKKQEGFVFVDKNYFTLLPHQWIAGNASSLKDPYSLVISEKQAKLYFPKIPIPDIIGKTVIVNDSIHTTIKGIVKELVANSDFKFTSFISLSTITANHMKSQFGWDDWGSINGSTRLLLKLHSGVNPAQINNQLASIIKERDQEDEGYEKTLHLQPLNDVHFNTDFYGPTDITVLRNLVLLAIFLLLLGAINFINLSTAQAANRAKEIGIRKTLGSSKKQLVFQFLTETFVLTFFTTILSLLITPLLLKAFSGFIPEGLHFSYFGLNPSVYGFLMLLIFAVSLLAGLYTAFILAKFKPVHVLKNQVVTNSGTTRAAWLRKSLIVFQFVIAQVFIIGMVVVNKQIHYSLQKDMGFKKDAIINFHVPFSFFSPEVNTKNIYLRDQLRQIPGIQEVSLANAAPAFNGWMTNGVSYNEKGNDVKYDVDSRNGDTAYLGVYGIKLLAGRNILASDTANELLINETFAKQLGFNQPANAIGHLIKMNNNSLPIVGVMVDFNQASMRTPIHPLIYFANQKRAGMMNVALRPNPDTWKATIAEIQSKWKNVLPNEEFDYKFLDSQIKEFYKSDQQLSQLLTWSSGVAIFISCLGLLGLVIFMSNSRVKEIGVRKVLGASAAQIIALLSKDFIKLLLVALAIAFPVAWWLTHNWLQDFAYHAALSWWVFAISGLIMLSIAMVILWIRTGRAAMANPVESLRSE